MKLPAQMAKTILQFLYSFSLQCVGGKFLYHVASSRATAAAVNSLQQRDTERERERERLRYCEMYQLSARMFEVFKSSSQ